MNYLASDMDHMSHRRICGQKTMTSASTEDLNELIDLLHRVTPLLERANLAMRQGSVELPQAKVHMQHVTAATEAAAMAIMDEADNIATLVKEINGDLLKARDAIKVLNDLVHEAQQSNEYSSDRMQKHFFSDLLKAVRIHEMTIKQSVENASEGLDNIKACALAVSMTMQVQDITSQKLAGAGHIVDRVENNLRAMFDSQTEDARSSTDSTTEAFNADASFDAHDDRQSAVDKLFHQASNNVS